MAKQSVRIAGTRESLVLRSDLAMMLLDLRNERGWTKKQLAKELGIGASTLSKLELGGQFRLWERTWRRIVPALARLLEVDPDELRPLGKELVAELVVATPGAGPAEVPDLSAQELELLLFLVEKTKLDDEGRRFMVEAYRMASRSSRPALAPAT